MRILRPLRHRAMALLWSGLSLSAIGDQLYAVALAWVAVRIFGPAAGYLSALSAALVLLLALGAGHWADGWDRRRTMIIADLGRALVLLALVLAWGWLGRPPAFGLVGAVVVLAVGQALFQPALQAVVPGCVGEPVLLPAANGLLDTTDRSARLLGPGLVALLGGVLPVIHFVTLDAISFLASAGAVTAIGAVGTVRREGPRGSVLASALRGFHVVGRHRLLRTALLVNGPVNGAWVAAFLLGLPLLIARLGVTGVGGSGFGAFGLVIAAYGCTNLLATLVIGGRPMPARPYRQIFSSKLVTGAGTALLAAVPLLAPDLRLAGFAAAAAFGAVGGPMMDIPVAVLRQTELPAAEVPAAMRAFMVASNTGTLAAMLIAPAAFARFGLAPVIAMCGMLIAAAGVFGFIVHAGDAAAPQRGETVTDSP